MSNFWQDLLSIFDYGSSLRGSGDEAGLGVIRSVLLELGIPAEPDDVEDDYFCWRFSQGSANLLLMLFKDHGQTEGEWVVQVSAVMVRLPEGSAHGLFEYCLTANMDLVDCYFALHHEADVVLTCKRRVVGLDVSALQVMLATVARRADLLDNQLAQLFDVQMWGRDA